MPPTLPGRVEKGERLIVPWFIGGHPVNCTRPAAFVRRLTWCSFWRSRFLHM
jgi:hypothetical protein